MARRAPATEGRCAVLVLAFFSILAAPGTPAAPTATGGTAEARPEPVSPTAVLDRTTVPATGRQTALLTVDRFGRYAVTVKSAQGVALQLVDHVAGPSPVSGEAGAMDGRVEGFLDHGDYRVVATAHEKGTGDATLAVHAFQEMSLPRPLVLPLQGTLDASLSDFQQRSWWVSIATRQVLPLEAAVRVRTGETGSAAL